MARNIGAGQTPRKAFPCTCNGCRGYLPELYAGASEYTVIQATRHMGSHYFDTDTRRFFRSRVLSWNIMNDGNPREPFGFLVRESRGAGFDPSDGREYAVSVWCRFGSLVAVWRGMRDGIPVQDPEQPFTVVESVRALTRTTFNDEAVRLLAACDCHGCQVWGHPWLARACEGCDVPAGEVCAVDCLGGAR